MFVAEKATGHLIEVLDTQALFDPHVQEVRGSLHYGEEAQDPESFAKSELAFPSGEALPVCWTDPDYRRHS
ncbi:acetyltransferase [Marinobacter salsuginis]|uniref:acetyltransferase n=1 Tax=Marinobacter salsuginis TaxID=418719 RepID=UPI001C9530CF|nr:acetyltransferase [Marinobacter salsuginis]MBY6071979.1 acetyltransferase [Marinobacter salsuginis]